jgi:metal-responsive CopG/Arc/MetJ family transcriptional regulator
MRNFNMKMSEELHRRFKVVCALEGTEMSEVIRKMIEQYLEKAEKRKLIVLPKIKN